MNPGNPADQVQYCVERLREGHEDAFFSLLEIDGAAEPLLLQAAASELDPKVRCELVEVVGQRRRTSSVPFLADRLFDQDWDVRQAAIDGLMTVNSVEARRALEQALALCRSSGEREARFAEYLIEAIAMIDETKDTRE